MATGAQLRGSRCGSVSLGHGGRGGGRGHAAAFPGALPNRFGGPEGPERRGPQRKQMHGTNGAGALSRSGISVEIIAKPSGERWDPAGDIFLANVRLIRSGEGARGPDDPGALRLLQSRTKGTGKIAEPARSSPLRLVARAPRSRPDQGHPARPKVRRQPASDCGRGHTVAGHRRPYPCRPRCVRPVPLWPVRPVHGC